jgi:competence protein ComEA
MKHQINLNLSKRNRRALLYLSLILLFIIYLPRIYFFISEDEIISLQSFPSEKWIKEKSQKTYFNEYQLRAKNIKRVKFTKPLSKFDPNNYREEDWIRLGLSTKQAKVVLNFSKRGLYSNEDLKRIFVISDELFNLIKDSTFYSLKKGSTILIDKSISKSNSMLIEINSATEEELLNIKGIGPFFAKQILKKRNELGGFNQVSQLKEVWKMEQENFEIIEPFIKIDNSKIIKIELNSVNLDNLKKHPYVRWNIANSIIKIREQKGGFKNIEEIKESVLINEEMFEKLKPYLSL